MSWTACKSKSQKVPSANSISYNWGIKIRLYQQKKFKSKSLDKSLDKSKNKSLNKRYWVMKQELE